MLIPDNVMLVLRLNPEPYDRYIHVSCHALHVGTQEEGYVSAHDKDPKNNKNINT